jgi:beta-glucanase (GH16 family)
MNIARLPALKFLNAVLLILLTSDAMAVRGQATGTSADSMPLIDFSSPDAAKQVAPTKGVPASLIVVDKSGISMSFPIQPAPHSGVVVTSTTGKPWDLSAYGHVEVKVTNLDKTDLPFVMHVVNGSEGRTQELNTEAVDIPAGETRTLTVYFGYQYGYEPSAAFNAASITEIYPFLYDTNQSHAFRIEELKAGGVPGEKPRIDPNTLAYRLPNGVILGQGVAFDVAKQAEAKGAQVSAGPNGTLAVDFAGGAEESVTIKPAIGMWDLSEANELRVKVKNVGQTPVTPAVEVGAARVSTTSPVAPGAEVEIVVPFTAAAATGGQAAAPGTAATFESDKAREFSLVSDATPGAKSLLVTSVVADAAVDDTPDWLGKKPPVDGDWTPTFDEEFKGPALDLSKWNIYTNNRLFGSRGWNANHNQNRRAHFSKDNVILSGGNADLRYEKKTGTNDDDPKGQKTDYASGYLSTYGKWTQRYGYFESRLKLPDAPGLWASFALVPGSGPAISPPVIPPAGGAAPRKVPTDLGAGGMEFDLVNFISHWGIYRFNVAARPSVHGEKALASLTPYVRADKDGYVTTGLLWTPGLAVFYNNGKEIFRWEDVRVSDAACCLRLDLVTGGSGNTHVDDSKLPADFIINYVRVWQRKDLASPADGPKANKGDPDEAKN